jgi:hypothetical protein
VGVCVGVARDLSKVKRETRSGRSQTRARMTFRDPQPPKQPTQQPQSRSSYAPVQLALCPECEATILAETTVCPHCDSPQPVCIVCNNSIVPLDSALSCPQCRGRAHRIHFLEFLKVKGVCPRCNTDLDPHELIDDSQIDDTRTPTSGPQHLCMVCNGIIQSTESALQCPNCEGNAHRTHFLEYLKVKGSCPHCENQLDARDLKET